MKTPLTFLLFLVFFQTKIQGIPSLDESDYWSKEKEQCVTELNLDREEIKALDEQEIITEDNSGFNRFAHCFFMKSGVQDVSGKIKYENIKQMFITKISQSYGYVNSENLELLEKVALDAVTWCENNIPSEADSPGQLAVRVGNCIMSYLRNANTE